jgi:hypothetical protein
VVGLPNNSRMVAASAPTGLKEAIHLISGGGMT